MAEYCSYDDVRKRLTNAGVAYVADRDQDGLVDTTEQAEHVTTSIQFAGRQIDYAICDQTETSTARASGNGFLKDLAIDLAAERCCGIGGGEIPAAMQAAADYARVVLGEVKRGRRIPDYTYPSQPAGTPRLNIAKTQPGIINFR